MNHFEKHKHRSGDLQIIGGISIDLNGMVDEIDSMAVERKTKIQMVYELFAEFCSNSTIHGIRYITQRKLHWVERVWWIIASILSVCLCTYAVYSIWMKWQQRPVIVSFNDKATSIGMIPFPAVTICTTKKFIKGKINSEKLLKIVTELQLQQTTISNLSHTGFNHLDAILQVCQKEKPNLSISVNVPRTESIYKIIKDIGPEMESVIIFSSFVKKMIDWKTIFTAEGLCYTFNSLNSRDIYSDEIAPELMTVTDNPNATQWSVENGFDLGVNETVAYPHHVFGASSRDVLNIRLGIEIDETNELCSEIAHGFRISLHSPDELPHLPDNFIFIPIEHDVFISVKPSMVTTSLGLLSYSPDVRGCFFEWERKLRFFKSYTQDNCELECLANATLDACGCVKFSMIRDKHTKICTINYVSCYMKASDEFSINLLLKKCDCLPECTSITYDVEISQASSAYLKSVSYRIRANESSYNTNSQLFISFKKQHFFGTHRSETTTFNGFASSCGGLLGLFMGISVLSIVELVYFFTLRLFFTLEQQKSTDFPKTKWAKRRNLLAIQQISH